MINRVLKISQELIVVYHDLVWLGEPILFEDWHHAGKIK